MAKQETVRARGGFWYTNTRYTTADGQRVRLRKSTGVLVGEGREFARSKRQAEAEVEAIVRREQDRAARHACTDPQALTLQTALERYLGDKPPDEQLVLDIFEHIDPKAPVAALAQDRLESFAAQLVATGKPEGPVRARIDFLRDLLEFVGLPKPPPIHRSHLLSIAKLIDLYWASVNLKPRTERTYRDDIHEWVEWCTGRIATAAQITPESIAEFSRFTKASRKQRAVPGGKPGQYMETSEPLDPGTVNRKLRSISSFLNTVRREKLLPPETTEAEIKDALNKPRPRKTKPRPLEVEQIHRELTIATRWEFGPYWWCALLSGMRKNELDTLQWTDLILRESAENSRYVIREENTKIGEARTVSLAHTPTLFAFFKAISAKRPAKSVYIFGRNRGKQPPKSFRNQFERAGVSGLQTLRQTCSTYGWCTPAIGPYLSSERLGHSVPIAQKKYTKFVQIPASVQTIEGAMQLDPDVWQQMVKRWCQVTEDNYIKTRRQPGLDVDGTGRGRRPRRPKARKGPRKGCASTTAGRRST